MARRLARGTQLQRSSGGATPTWVKIAQAISYDGPNMSADVTALDDHDVTAGYKAKIKTGLDAGQITVNVHLDLDDATHAEAFSDFGDLEGWADYRLIHPTGTKMLTFNAAVVGITPAAPVDGAVTANIVFELQGGVTIAAKP